jgi:hypothetical protein
LMPTRRSEARAVGGGIGCGTRHPVAATRATVLKSSIKKARCNMWR